MAVVLKYKLSIQDSQTVSMSANADMLSAQFQGSDLVLWALVDPDKNADKNYIVRILATGEKTSLVGLGSSYVSTAQDPLSGQVWHVFADYWE